MKEYVGDCSQDDVSGQSIRLKWIPIPLEPAFMWKPAGLEAADVGWFFNLLEASLRSEWPGYLVLDNPETLWRIAGAKHPATWKQHGAKVLAHFEHNQMHGRSVLFFPPLVKSIEEQQKKLRGKRSRFPKNQQVSEGSAAFSLPLIFDSDVGVDSKIKKDGGENMDVSDPALQEHRKSARRILEMFGLPLTDANLRVTEAAVAAEVAYTGQSSQEAAELIANNARRDRDNGVPINKFYFEDAKWRNGNAGYKPSASQQRSERTKQNILDGIAAEIGRRNKSDGHQ